MAQYTAIFTKPYEDGYENLPSQNTPITAETLNDKDNAIVNIETYLSGNDIPSDAEGLSYDNTDSGLTADNVQSAIDEIVMDIPTVNNGTLTIQKNGEDVATFTANQSGNSTANLQVKEPDCSVKTNTTGQFNTITGGLLESCVVNLEPVQSGSGTPSPDNVRPITGHTSVEVDVTDADSNTTQYTISLGQTVYGGTLDVVSGVLTVTHGFLTENSFTEVNTNTSTGGLHWTDVMISAITDTEVICNKIKTVPSTQGWSSTTPCIQEGAITATQYSVRIYCAESNITDFRTTYSGLQIVYKLPTPLTIQLTPQQIETLIGQNNISVPLTGQSLDSLTYREVLAWDDVERAINVKLDLSSVAPIEYTDKASQSYNQKQLFIKDNKLCQALTSISSGASFTENTNFKYTTLAEIIEPLL